MTMISPLLAGLMKVPGGASPGTKPDEQAAADPLFAAIMAMMFTPPQTGVPTLPLQPDGAASAVAGGVTVQTPAQALLAQVAGQLQQLVSALAQQTQATPDGGTPATDFFAKLAAMLQSLGEPSSGQVLAGQPASGDSQAGVLADLQELVVTLDQTVPPAGGQPDPTAVGKVLDLIERLTTTQPEVASELVASLAQAAPAPSSTPAPVAPARPDAGVTPVTDHPEGQKSALIDGEKTQGTPQPAQAVRTGRVRAAVENPAGRSHDPAPLQATPPRSPQTTTAFTVEQAEQVTATPGRQATLALTPDRLVQAVVNAAESSPPGRYSVTVRLVPEHLGEVRLQLQLEGNKVQAVMLVSNTGAQRALEEHGEQLRQGLDQRGLQLTGFSVSTGNPNQTPQDRQAQLEDWQQSLRRSGVAQVVPAPATPVAPREVVPGSNGRRGNRLDTLA